MEPHQLAGSPGAGPLADIFSCVASSSDSHAATALANCAMVCRSWHAALLADARPWRTALQQQFGCVWVAACHPASCFQLNVMPPPQGCGITLHGTRPMTRATTQVHAAPGRGTLRPTAPYYGRHIPALRGRPMPCGVGMQPGERALHNSRAPGAGGACHCRRRYRRRGRCGALPAGVSAPLSAPAPLQCSGRGSCRRLCRPAHLGWCGAGHPLPCLDQWRHAAAPATGRFGMDRPVAPSLLPCSQRGGRRLLAG